MTGGCEYISAAQTAPILVCEYVCMGSSLRCVCSRWETVVEWPQVSGSGDAMDQGSDWSIGLRERRDEQQRSNNTMNERTRRLVPWFVVVVTGSMSLG